MPCAPSRLPRYCWPLVASLAFMGSCAAKTIPTTPPVVANDEHHEPSPRQGPDEVEASGEVERPSGTNSIELGPLPTGVMARVGGVEIPMSAFMDIYTLKVDKYLDRGRTLHPAADRRYRKSIAERLIYHEVLAQEVAREGVDYDPARLAAHQARIRRGIRDWARHLERRGETEASLEAMIVAELREAVLLEHTGALDITDVEIDEDYEKIKPNWYSNQPRVRASHILILVGPPGENRQSRDHDDMSPPPGKAQVAKWTKEALREARRVLAEATKPGADFAALAREHSTGPSASKGGEIGIFTHDRMAEAFSNEAFSMKVGQISGPVQTKYGFHIIKVTGRWPAGDLPRDALADEIRARLHQRKLHEGRRELKARLVETTEVVDHIGPTLGPEPDHGHERRRREAHTDAALQL